MKINKEHLYHGAALNQIAEHEQFTAINTLEINEIRSRSAFKINQKISIYLKYCTKQNNNKEYVFTFTIDHLDELSNIHKIGDVLYLVLICVEGHEICCISYATLSEMILERRNAAEREEDQYQLLATLEPGKGFGVYMNAYQRRNVILGNPRRVPRNLFPNILFA